MLRKAFKLTWIFIDTTICKWGLLVSLCIVTLQNLDEDNEDDDKDDDDDDDEDDNDNEND